MDMINKDPKTWAAFEAYCQWLSLPRHFANYTDDELEAKGFNFELIELLKIKYKKDFAIKFCVSGQMLTDWDKHPDLHANIKKNWKKWGKSLTPGLMGKFAEKLAVEADPARMGIWLKYVEEEGKEESGVNVHIGIENVLKALKEDGEIKDESNGKKD